MEAESLKDTFIQNGDFWTPDSGVASSRSSQLALIEGNSGTIEDPFISLSDDSWLIADEDSLSASVIQNLYVVPESCKDRVAEFLNLQLKCSFRPRSKAFTTHRPT